MSGRSLLGSSGLGAGGQTVINITNNDNAGDSGTPSSGSLAAAAPLAIASGTISLATDPASLVLDSATGKLKVAPAVTGAVTNATTNCGLLAARVTTIESSTVPGVQATAEKARDDLTALTSTTTTLSTSVQQNTSDIGTLQTRLTGDETNIAANASQVANNLAAINTLAGTVSSNTTNISANTTDITTLKAATNVGGPTVVRDTIQGDTTPRSYPPVRGASDTFTVTGQPYGNGTYVTSASSTNGPVWSAWQSWTPTPDGNTQFPTANKYNTSGNYVGTTSTALTGGGSLAGEWTQIQFPVARYCTAYTLSFKCGTPGSFPTRFQVMAQRANVPGWLVVYTQDPALVGLSSSTPNLTATFATPGYYTAIRVICQTNGGVAFAIIVGYVTATAPVVNIPAGIDTTGVALNGASFIDAAGKVAGVDIPLLKSTSDSQATTLTSLNANYTTLSSTVGTNTTDITGLKTRVTTTETNIGLNTTNIASNTSDITTLKAAAGGTIAGDTTVRPYPVIPLTNTTTVASGQTYGNGTYTASASSTFNGFLPHGAWAPVPSNAYQWPSGSGKYNSSGTYVGSVSSAYDGGSVAGEWNQLALPSPRYCTSYTQSYQSGAANAQARQFAVLGLRGSTWTVAYATTSATTPAPTSTTPNRTFAFTTPGYYSAIRLVITETFGNDFVVLNGYISATTQVAQAPQGIDSTAVYVNGTPLVVPVVPAIPKWYKLTFTAPGSITLNSPTFVGLTYTGLGGSAAPTDAIVLATPTSAWIATLPASFTGQMKYASPASFFVNFVYPTGNNVGCAVYVTFYDSALAGQTFTAYAWYF